MNLDALKKIIKVVEESDIDELEIRGFFRRIRVTKRLPAQVLAPPGSSSASTVKEVTVGKKKTIEEPEEKLASIKAPMVGTFYHSPSPGASPYVDIGDQVTPGKVVCVIEAMKVMNEIESEITGTVKQVLVKNEEPVEYGQNLFLVEPAQ